MPTFPTTPIPIVTPAALAQTPPPTNVYYDFKPVKAPVTPVTTVIPRTSYKSTTSYYKSTTPAYPTPRGHLTTSSSYSYQSTSTPTYPAAPPRGRQTYVANKYPPTIATSTPIYREEARRPNYQPGTIYHEPRKVWPSSSASIFPYHCQWRHLDLSLALPMTSYSTAARKTRLWTEQATTKKMILIAISWRVTKRTKTEIVHCLQKLGLFQVHNFLSKAKFENFIQCGPHLRFLVHYGRVSV